MKSNPEYDYLIRSSEIFRKDLQKIEIFILNGIFLDQNLLEIMAEIVAIKEDIEALEDIYCNKY
ncbi:MAG: hypothetical protein ACJAS6_001157 [Rickettsiales bacterium]|jgi:hypothetical protein